MYVVYGALIVLFAISTYCILYSITSYRNQIWLRDRLEKSIDLQQSLGATLLHLDSYTRSIAELAKTQVVYSQNRLSAHAKSLDTITSILRDFSRQQTILIGHVERTAELVHLHDQVLRRSARQQRQREMRNDVF